MRRNDRAAIAALGWLGTPYVHQASCKGGGTDCLGLVRGVWREVLGGEPALVPPYTPDWAEQGQEEMLLIAAGAHLEPIGRAEISLGSILVFRLRQGAIAKHLGIVSQVGPAPKFVHAYTGHGVVESSLSRPWEQRIAGIFNFPEERT